MMPSGQVIYLLQLSCKDRANTEFLVYRPSSASYGQPSAGPSYLPLRLSAYMRVVLALVLARVVAFDQDVTRQCIAV